MIKVVRIVKVMLRNAFCAVQEDIYTILYVIFRVLYVQRALVMCRICFFSQISIQIYVIIVILNAKFVLVLLIVSAFLVELATI